MANSAKELESFDKRIRVLEDALEKAAEILGGEERPFPFSHHSIEYAAYQVYEKFVRLTRRYPRRSRPQPRTRRGVKVLGPRGV